MILPDEIDFCYIQRWLEHGDKVIIAGKVGKTKQWVSQVLNKKGKDFKIIQLAYEQARQNERMVLGKNN